jgi:FKBP-type peptidyl-prolyl cis-trans isomerase
MKLSFCLFLVVVFLASCNNGSGELKIEPNGLNEKLADANKVLLQSESAKIDSFIHRHSINATRTGTGLRYEIYNQKEGIRPGVNDVVEINVKVYLLDDRLCYSTDSSGPLKFQIGRGEQLKGLEEGILQMNQGASAHLVLPAHLAYGMQGDGAEIPPASALYIDVVLLKVNK